MRTYCVSEMNICRTSEIENMLSINSNMNMPKQKKLSVQCTIEMLDYNSETFRSIEDFENFLRVSTHDWADADMIEAALREKYPERFL